MDLIYADYAATTPLDPRVLEAMLPYLTDTFYNAASSHAAGMQAQHAVMKSRMEIASHIGAKMNDIIFTSGATEAINLAIIGAARRALADGTRNRIVTMHTEHAAVRDAAEYCATLGIDVVWVPCDANGTVQLDAVRHAVTDRTIMLCVMAVNNETGVMQHLVELSAIAHSKGASFMTDATQAYGKMPLDVDALGIDVMPFSAHKIYGPKGCGALYMRSSGNYACSVEPLLYGGGQERGLRSGTLNVPGIVGFATAGTIAYANLSEESVRIASLRDRFEQEVMNIPGTTVNGSGAMRSYNISNVEFASDADMMLVMMPNVACSKGSACSSAKPKPSPVLTAMGRTAEQAGRSLRFSFGRMSSDADIDHLVSAIQEACSQRSQ